MKRKRKEDVTYENKSVKVLVHVGGVSDVAV